MEGASGSRHCEGIVLHRGREEQEAQLPFSSSQSFGDESGKHPRNPSDLKFSAENQVLPDVQGCHPENLLQSHRARLPHGQLDQAISDAQRHQSFRRKARGSTRKTALCSQPSGMRESACLELDPYLGCRRTQCGEPMLSPQQLVVTARSHPWPRCGLEQTWSI